MKNLLIVGTGGFAREVYWHAHNSKGYNTDFIIKGFLEGDVPIAPNRYSLMPTKVLDNVLNYYVQKDDVFVIAIADPKTKKRIADILDTKHCKFINLIHETALVSPTAVLGYGLILCPYTVITCNTNIGNHIMLNLYSSIGHDSRIGDYTSLMCYVDISGNVKIGKYNFWGNCSSVIPSCKIENNVKVGAGAVVVRDLKEKGTYIGVPAKLI